MENINSSVVSTMIETVIIEVAKNKNPGQMSLQASSIRYLVKVNTYLLVETRRRLSITGRGKAYFSPVGEVTLGSSKKGCLD